MEIAPFTITTSDTKREPVNTPQIELTAHSDGLGWSVRVTQDWVIDSKEEEVERWSGYRYRQSKTTGRQVLLTAGTPLTCPGTVLARVLSWGYHLMGLLDGPEPTWLQFYEYCVVPLHGLDPATRHWTTEPQGRTIQQRSDSILRQPVHEGQLLLQWTRPDSDPIGIAYPISRTTTSVDLRLRELAELVLRDRTPDALDAGRLALTYSASSTDPITVYPTTPSRAMVTALETHHARVPEAQWPHPIQVRIANAAPQVQRLAEDVLTQLNIPIVSRGAGQLPLRRVQQEEASQHFTDSPRPTIGHWEPATVLLVMEDLVHTRTHHTIDVTALAVETGRILGHVSMEAPPIWTPAFEGALRGELHTLMSFVPKRQGTLIEDRR